MFFEKQAKGALPQQSDKGGRWKKFSNFVVVPHAVLNTQHEFYEIVQKYEPVKGKNIISQ